MRRPGPHPTSSTEPPPLGLDDLGEDAEHGSVPGLAGEVVPQHVGVGGGDGVVGDAGGDVVVRLGHMAIMPLPAQRISTDSFSVLRTLRTLRRSGSLNRYKTCIW